MRAVIQRVNYAEVCVNQKRVSQIGQGLLVYLGIGNDDNEADKKYMAEKIPLLRIFEDSSGKMNLSVKDIQGEILLVSQFTLYGDCRKGRRPGFDAAMAPDQARKMFDEIAQMIVNEGYKVKTGIFQAHMLVRSENDGPINILLDSKKLF